MSEQFQFCFKCKRSFKDISRKFPECFNEVSMVFQESLTGVSWKIEGFLGRTGCFKEVSRDFKKSLKGVTFDVSRAFQRSQNNV